jgi:hypothetical protein
MPGKRKHGKSKRPYYSKKSKAIKRGVAASQSPATAAPVAPSVAAAPTQKPVVAPAKAAAVPARATAAQYPHFIGELKRIGILALIILVVLIVLSVILS